MRRDTIIVETHDAVLEEWRRAGMFARTVVHIDAHHDCWGVSPGATVTPANYLAAAAREGLVARVVWVLPDGSWADGDRREAVDAHVASARATLGSVPLEVTRLPDIRDEDGPVLLDIDVDFLVMDHVEFGRPDVPSAPWTTPRQVSDAASRIGWDLATIAVSVEGGFTPLEWRFLALELRERLGGAGAAVAGFERLREAVRRRTAGDLSGARASVHAASASLNRCAAVVYEEALQAYASGKADDACRLYREATALDEAYGTRFRSIGLRFEAAGRLDEAEAEHRRALALDPRDAYAALGLGRVHARRDDLLSAEYWFRQALSGCDTLPDAWNGLSDALRHRRALPEAIRAATRALMLTLRGSESLAPDGSFHRNPNLGAQHARLADLYAAAGDVGRAEEERRLATAWAAAPS